MPQFNYKTGEIIAKIVYYGPSFGGKTTSLQWLHSKLKPRYVGQLYSLDTQDDRTLFFDMLPISFGRIGWMKLRVKVYTVPGQVKYDSTRKMVLTGVDAVIFVADSETTRCGYNMKSLSNLATNLTSKGMSIHTIPLVFQYNKRDLPNVLPVEIMNENLNFKDLPSFASIAIDPCDQGVLNAFVSVLVSLVKSFGLKYRIENTSDKPIDTQYIADRLEQSLREKMIVGVTPLTNDGYGLVELCAED